MCEVTSFCCGCADLRKGALIIGSLNLFFAVIQVAYNGYLLIAVQDPAVLRQLQAQGTSVEHAWLVSLILGLLVGASVIRAVVNVLLIMKAQKPGDGAGHTLPWLIFTGIFIVIGLLSILGGSFSSIPDIALSSYFFVVILSYRKELKGEITVRFPGQEPVSV